MSYEPTLVPKVQEFVVTSDWEEPHAASLKGALMTCSGCGQSIWITTLQQAVAQADLHEQEKHLEYMYELPPEISQAV